MMEIRKSAIKTINQCRFCLSSDESLSSIYDRSRTPKNTVTLPLQILSCVSVEVFPSDGMPSMICDCCRFFIDVFYRFKQICRSADESILQHIQAGDELMPVPWALKLKRIFQNANRTTKKVKTLVSETGATVQVTASNDLSDSEEDDDNVYNIKIEEGENQEGTCIKVTKAGEELHLKKGDSKPDKRRSNKALNVTPDPEAGNTFKCKFCDKTFAKAYYYTRHMRQKHKDVTGPARGPFGQLAAFRCEQCSEEFVGQDELIYHSAKHATENLTCPLCQEKFSHVEEVSAHIKTHVEGAEFMCDLCELVFTARGKLDAHLARAHAHELRLEQEQELDEEPMDEDEAEETSHINVKEENGEMIVEITKPEDYMITEDKSADESNLNTNSEESEAEASYLEVGEEEPARLAPRPARAPAAANKLHVQAVHASNKTAPAQKSSILKKAEEIKKQTQKPATAGHSLQRTEVKAVKAVTPTASPVKAPATPATPVTPAAAAAPPTPAVPTTPPPPAPGPAPAPAPASATADKSLRLLEKELQELQRTNSRSEPQKTPAKAELRGRRPQLHTSTPKPRAIEEKKASSKTAAVVDKKAAEKRTPITKENKEPKEAKGGNNSAAKEEKSLKNGSERGAAEDGVRRSGRASKVADYAKMNQSRESSDDSDDEDEEYTEEEPKETKPVERGRGRRAVGKPPLRPRDLSPPERPPAAPAPAPARKRGRPRKDQASKDLPVKVRKVANLDDSDKTDDSDSKTAAEEPKKPAKEAAKEYKGTPKVTKDTSKTEKLGEEQEKEKASERSAAAAGEQRGARLLVSPTGQPLKKVAARALPPGVTALPLPANSRPISTGEVCEMQIGKKVVKVQKIVMTKAEVEAMAKKGLVEMKDGTMVLKQGIKLPSADVAALKSSLVGEESPKKPLPTRCDFDDDS